MNKDGFKDAAVIDIYRWWQLFLSIVSLLVLFTSLYLQFVKGLHPCPLCVMQRLCVIFALMISFMGVVLGRTRGSKVLIVLQVIVIVAGLYFSGRQLWLQSLPVGHMPACLPGLDVLIRYFPWRDILQALVWGSADCGEITWQWLGLSMPAWSALYFLGMFIGTFLTRYTARRVYR